ncbi:cytochrome C oxidase mono-heme subunit/FixO [Pirellula staleyi DSM 6068]|uniref:Cytochrome C oxidase mono-heme subunit/FixO n=1 Tax=Pirellula staleyi (strain ATCC 27377 / DSM 6068 / ICPB 4128) TaxID=530564 RepID=D2QYL4_PIRSD|nr:cbb3-type cytochrome c oxidase subunit II [Pirellula staleyi]ADB18173.1 cytochrome C oxidase mono-heme subunit/FixO [Pirellula staleyi DSM 6068]
MFESKTGILFIAGVGFFVFAFLSNGALPMLMYKDLPEKTAEQVVNPRLVSQFRDLEARYQESFVKAFGELPPPTPVSTAKDDPQAVKNEQVVTDKAAEALRLGRQVYIGEGCWHCHSQFVRPVSNESLRFGPVSKTEEYQNELQRPVMFGTRRVGPDLSREGGRRSNDWHAVHFFQPTIVSKGSPMPSYPWLFEGAPDKPNRRGLALIAYVQWLGSWQESYPYYEELSEVKGDD